MGKLFMSRIKEILAEEKKNMPKYQYDFLYKRVMPGFFFVLGGAIVIVILIIIFTIVNPNHIFIFPYIVLGFWVIATIILLVLFVIKIKEINKKLLNDKTVELEEKYKLCEYYEAVEYLERHNIIIDNQIIIDDEMIPIKECDILFFCKTWSGAFYFYIYFYDKVTKLVLNEICLDKNSCTYFYNNKIDLINNEVFELFIRDKRKFLELLYKYNDAEKILKHIKKKAI